MELIVFLIGFLPLIMFLASEMTEFIAEHRAEKMKQIGIADQVAPKARDEKIVSAPRQTRIRTNEEIQKEIEWDWENKLRVAEGKPALPLPDELAWIYSDDENIRFYGPTPEKAPVAPPKLKAVTAKLEPPTVEEKSKHTVKKMSEQLVGDNGPVATQNPYKVDPTLTGFPLRRAVWVKYKVVSGGVGITNTLDRNDMFRKYYGKALREGVITSKQYNELMKDSFESDALWRDKKYGTKSSLAKKKEALVKEVDVREIDGLMLADTLLVWNVIGSVEHKELLTEVREKLSGSREYRRMTKVVMALRGRKSKWKLLPITGAVAVSYEDVLENKVTRIFTTSDFHAVLSAAKSPKTKMSKVLCRLYKDLKITHPLKVAVMRKDGLTEEDIERLANRNLTDELNALQKKLQTIEDEKKYIQERSKRDKEFTRNSGFYPNAYDLDYARRMKEWRDEEFKRYKVK